MIGYGNSLSTDDGFGRAVAEELRTKITDETIEIISAHQLTPELVEPISKAESVIFVDARVNIPSGELRCERLGNGSSEKLDSSWVCSHRFNPETLLDGVQELYGYAPPAWLYTIGGEDFRLGETLSPAIQKMVPEAAALILKHICDFPSLKSNAIV